MRRKWVLYLIISLSSIYGYSQNNNVINIEMKILSKEEGLALLDNYKFDKCLEFKEDEEHNYYEGYENGYLIYNKYLGDFVFYKSKSEFEKVLSQIENNILEPEINFTDFESNVSSRIDKLGNFFNINISENDNLEGLKKIDYKIREQGKTIVDFPDLFLNFFSYYYAVLKNEIGFIEYEIFIEGDIISFYIDSRREIDIFRKFYKLMVDNDNNGNLYLCADEIINPFNLPIGNPQNAPIKD